MKLTTWYHWQSKLRKPIRGPLIFVLLATMVSSHSVAFAATNVGLNDVIQMATEKSEAIKAVEKSISSIEAEIAGRELELSPVITSNLSSTENRQATVQLRRQSSARLIDVSLTKLFATGTAVSVGAGHQLTTVDAIGTRNFANWDVSLTQDLWRNDFGRSTRLRRKSDAAELKSRRFTAYNQRQDFIVTLETAYWDLSLALKEEKIRLANLERSKTLETWIRDRVRRSAAERTDLLQVQALVSQRELELLATRNRIEDTRTRFRQLIPGATPESWDLNLDLLDQSRDMRSLLVGGATASSAQPVRIDVLSTQYSSTQAQIQAERVDDNLDPLLQAFITYGQNGIENDFKPSWDQAVAFNNNPATTVGLRFSVPLDTDLRNQQRTAARLNAQARELEAKATTREGALAWNELQRQISNLNLQVEQARKLSQYQESKMREERRRYSQGRTTAFQAITFEIDAATAELNLYQLLSNLRKLESLARSFTLSEDVNI